jgi:hypothetical protein
VTRAAERAVERAVEHAHRRNLLAGSTAAVERALVVTVLVPEQAEARVPRRSRRVAAVGVAEATVPSVATTPVGRRRWTVRAEPRVEDRRRTAVAVVHARRRAAVLRAVVAVARRAAAVVVAAAAAADVREGAKSCAHSLQSMARRHP